jgi:hypothetical protein
MLLQRLFENACQPGNNRMRNLLFISFLLFVVSCTKDSADLTNGNGTKLYRILVNGVVQQEFGYDSKGRMVSSVGYVTTGIKSSESKAYYDDNNRLVKLENSFNVSSSMSAVQMDNSYNEFIYAADGRLAETKTFRISGASTQLVSRSIPIYDAKGRTISVSIVDPVTGQVGNKTVYAYNGDDNVIMSELFQYNAGISGPTQHLEYEYDSNKNPFRGQWVMPYGTNANNITKIVGTSYLSAPGVPGGTATTLTLYKSYNKEGYPTLVNEYGVDYVYEYK